MNNKGLKPLHVISLDYVSTFINLFKLEKFINAEDYNGNTLMHLLMMADVDEEILEEIKLSSSRFEVYFSVQNKKGQTPLHIAAETHNQEDGIDFVLSNIDEFNPLLRDLNGNTFLHKYIQKFRECKSVLSKILDGKYKCCFGECLKQLVESRNDMNETLFQVFVAEAGLYDLEICKKFLKVGADFNCCNIKGETVLHKLHGCDEDEFPVIDFILRNGTDLNKTNFFLETPLFTSKSVLIMKLLLDNGANVNAQNKVGKSVLMVNLLESAVDPEIVETLLKYGADVNATDIHGNSCLHYAAWNYVSKEVVQQLKLSGTDIRENNIGELPCNIAEKKQHYGLLDELCVCVPGMHKLQTLRSGVIKIEDIQQKAFDIKESTDESGVDDLLQVSNSGSVEFTGEAEELKQVVTEVVRSICQAIGERDKLLKNKVFQSGSVVEKTKVGLPDEFDFICLIDFISIVCDVDQERSEYDPGYAYVQLKEEHLGEECRDMFDADCYLESDSIYLRFVSALRAVIDTPEFYSHPNLVFHYDETKEGPLIPNCKFSLRWTGALYTDIVVDVDLVPACCIPCWWPTDANLDSIVGDNKNLKSEGAILLMQINVDEDYVPQAKLRVSAQSAEKMHMKALPQLARDSYMVSKILCSDDFCPKVELEENSYLKHHFTSYMLKNCMFHVFKEVQVEDDAETRGQPSQTLKDIVVRIFKKLISFTESENLPAFVFPWQNVFTFQEGPDDDDGWIAGCNKRNCMSRKIYAKLILDMLDEDVDFTDCDAELATDSLI